MASATRAPAARRTRPGRRTAPATWTTSSGDAGPAPDDGPPVAAAGRDFWTVGATVVDGLPDQASQPPNTSPSSRTAAMPARARDDGASRAARSPTGTRSVNTVRGP